MISLKEEGGRGEGEGEGGVGTHTKIGLGMRPASQNAYPTYDLIEYTQHVIQVVFPRHDMLQWQFLNSGRRPANFTSKGGLFCSRASLITC